MKRSRQELVFPGDGGIVLAGGEIGVEDVDGGRGQGRAGVRPLDGDGHGDFRVVVGGEADEHAVVLRVRPDLGGAGLRG